MGIVGASGNVSRHVDLNRLRQSKKDAKVEHVCVSKSPKMAGVSGAALSKVIAQDNQVSPSSVLYIDSLDAFQRLTQDVSIDDEGRVTPTSGQLGVADESGESIVIVLDYTKIPPEDAFKLNLVWDGTHPLIKDLKSPVKIVGLSNQKTFSTADTSIRSRLQDAADESMSDISEQPRPTFSVVECSPSLSKKGIHLYENPDFESSVLGAPSFALGKFEVLEGELLRVLEEGGPLILHNPPSDRKALESWLTECVEQGYVYFNNSIIDVPSDLEVHFVEGYDASQSKSALNSVSLGVSQSEIESAGGMFLHVSHESIDELICSLRVDNGSVQTKSVFETLNEGVAIVLDSNLSESDIHRLFQHLSECELPFEIPVLKAPTTMLPSAFSDMPIMEYRAKPTQNVKYAGNSKVPEYVKAGKEDALVLDASNINLFSQALLPVQFESFQDLAATTLRSDVLDALESGREVVLLNSESSQSAQQLATMLSQSNPCIVLNGELLSVPNAKVTLVQKKEQSGGKPQDYRSDTDSTIKDAIEFVVNNSDIRLDSEDNTLYDMVHAQAVLERSMDRISSESSTQLPYFKAVSTTLGKHLRSNPRAHSRFKQNMAEAFDVSHLAIKTDSEKAVYDYITVQSFDWPDSITFDNGLRSCVHDFLNSSRFSDSFDIRSFLESRVSSEVTSEDLDKVEAAFAHSLSPDVSKNRPKYQSQRRLYRFSEKVTHSMMTFIKGEAGAGKSDIVRQLVSDQSAAFVSYNVGPETTSEDLLGVNKTKEGGTRFVDGPIAEWARLDGDGLKVLLLDEANLAKPGTFDVLKSVFSSPPYVVVNGEVVELSPKHRIVMTGNPEHYEGRFQDPFVTSVASPMYFKPFSDAFIECNVVRPHFESLPVATELREEGVARCMDVLAACKRLPEGKNLDVRRTEGILGVFSAYAANQIPESSDDIVAMFVRSIQDATFGGISKDTLYSVLYFLDPSSCDTVMSSECGVSDAAIKDAFTSYMEARDPDFCSSLSSTDRYVSFLGSRMTLLQQEKELDTHHGLKRCVVVESAPGQGKDVMTRGVLESLNVDVVEPKQVNVEGLREALEKAMKDGATLLLSDFSLPTAVMEQELNGVLDKINTSRSSAPFKPGFMIVVLKNSSAMVGRDSFSNALLSRSESIGLPHFSRDELVAVTRHMLPDSGDHAERIVNVYLGLESKLPEAHRSFRDFQSLLKGIRSGGDISTKSVLRAFESQYKRVMTFNVEEAEHLMDVSVLPKSKESVKGTPLETFASLAGLSGNLPPEAGVSFKADVQTLVMDFLSRPFIGSTLPEHSKDGVIALRAKRFFPHLSKFFPLASIEELEPETVRVLQDMPSDKAFCSAARDLYKIDIDHATSLPRSMTSNNTQTKSESKSESRAKSKGASSATSDLVGAGIRKIGRRARKIGSMALTPVYVAASVNHWLLQL